VSYSEHNLELSLDSAVRGSGRFGRRGGSALQSILVLTSVFVLVCVGTFLLATLIWPKISLEPLSQPFLGAFAMWTLGVGAAVAFTGFRSLTVTGSISLESTELDKVKKDSSALELLSRYINLGEYWGLSFDPNRREFLGSKGCVHIRCRVITGEDGHSGGGGEERWSLDLSGIPLAYGLRADLLEASTQGQQPAELLLDAFSPETRATALRFMRSGAHIDKGRVYIELDRFEEDLVDAAIEMAEELADTTGVVNQLVEHYRRGVGAGREHIYLDAVFSLPMTRSSGQLAYDKLRDEDLDVRIIAATHLGDTGVHVLESIAARPNSGLGVRLRAITELARQDADRALEVPGARSFCIQALRSGDEEVVVCAIQALEHIGDRNVVQLLVPLVNAKGRFREIGKRAIAAINERL
jgi:hypothetical protein